MTFNDFSFHEALQSGLRDTGYSEPTPIQEQAIPIILEQKDLIGAAQTGTGKTGAFVIPILQKILENKSDHTQALILSPTRELAQQIDEQIFALGYHTGISSANVIGGANFAQQANAIRGGVDIIVATPGRLIDQMKVLDMDLSHIKYLVLDEADRMLDMGFLPDVTKIIKQLPQERQTLLFSATMPGEIKKLANQFMKNPEKIEIEIEKPSGSITQKGYFVDQRQKLKLVQQVLDELEWESCIIFCATKRGTDQLEQLLVKNGINAGSIHGDRDQDERNKALHDFKSGKVPVIVATDVLARGIDIDNVSLIINYDVPRQVEDYVHRIGRTGRYDKTGIAVTFVNKKDKRAFSAIQDKVGDQLEIMEQQSSRKKSSRKSSRKSDDNQSSKKSDSKSASNNSNKNEDSKSSDNNSVRKKKLSDKEIQAANKRVENLKSVKVVLKHNLKKDKKQDNKPASKDKGKSSKSSSGKSSSSSKKSSRKNVMPAERIKKATKRNQNAPKPAKGLWGLIKSFFS
ncbi:DEAD/DEAH box helicase [Gracilimonas mengyeensis]|uniref:Superfamily II DNA and RNA helicase n=1 Tax=Gracilimonas mengyeensis TaxID=1302730 RepID=A0A521AM36_9BACT|nr:DEAD/DEAH box helicase [Gracilimonas mengyeensis]SMO35869.1 Superfamily II DNA and RNA helicase [Gracilimonas mengyeensis]